MFLNGAFFIRKRIYQQLLKPKKQILDFIIASTIVNIVGCDMNRETCYMIHKI